MAEHGKIGELGDSIAEQPIHSYRSGRIAGFEIVPDRGSVLLGFRRPDDIHVRSVVIRARRAAKSASTASLERRLPSCTETRTTSTLRRRKAASAGL
jgi:hypothetical protein